MKQVLILLTVFFTSNLLLSQSIKLTGKVISDLKNYRLYFTFNEEAFDSLNYVVADAENNYEFNIKLKDITAINYTQLHFSGNFNTNQSKRFSCVQTIELSEILSLKKLNTNKNFSILTDIDFETNCTAYDYSGAKEKGLERFLGNYILKDNKNNTRIVSLLDFRSRFNASYSKPNDLFNEDEGWWSYNEENMILTIRGVRKRNTSLGIFKEEFFRYKFSVDENESGIFFQSENFSLIKIK